MKIVVRLKDGVLGVLNELQPQMMTQRAVNQHRLARQDEHLQHRVGRAIGAGRPIGIEIEDQLLALAGRHGGYELDAVVRDGINHDVFRGSKLALASFAERKPHIPAPIGHVEPHNPAVFN